jgi:hypothetical protein
MRLVFLTQDVRLLRHISPEDSRSQPIDLLPKRVLATAIELSAEALVAEQLSEVFLAQGSRKLDKRGITAQVCANDFHDVENVIDGRAGLGDGADLAARDCAE